MEDLKKSHWADFEYCFLSYFYEEKILSKNAIQLNEFVHNIQRSRSRKNIIRNAANIIKSNKAAKSLISYKSWHFTLYTESSIERPENNPEGKKRISFRLRSLCF
jgi:hypothetical protein